jgi:hypothetical protein
MQHNSLPVRDLTLGGRERAGYGALGSLTGIVRRNGPPPNSPERGLTIPVLERPGGSRNWGLSRFRPTRMALRPFDLSSSSAVTLAFGSLIVAFPRHLGWPACELRLIRWRWHVTDLVSLILQRTHRVIIAPSLSSFDIAHPVLSHHTGHESWVRFPGNSL